MDQTLQITGIVNAWTMPIKARIDMLSTGIRTPIGIKIKGPNSAKISRSARTSRRACKRSRARATVYAERVDGGYYLDFKLMREEIARYGLALRRFEDGN